MTNDYLLRQIEEMARALALFVMNKRDEDIVQIVDEDGGFAKEHFLRYLLKKYVLDGRVNDAENILFETVEQDPDPVYLPVALAFYEDLGHMEEAKLACMDYSLQEVHDGMRDIARVFGVQPPPPGDGQII